MTMEMINPENQGVDSSNLSLGIGGDGGGNQDPSPFDSLGGMTMTEAIATLVDWAFAPQWLTLSEACFLSGYDPSVLRGIIKDDGVDLDNQGRIEKKSLRHFMEADLLVNHWEG
jgi:hypothetical protein